MSSARFTSSRPSDIKVPEPSYFALRSGTPDATTPSESHSSTPLSTPDENAKLMTPGSKPRRFRLTKAKIPLSLRSHKPIEKDGAGHTRLQARWLDVNKEKRRGSESSSEGASSEGIVTPDYAAIPIDSTAERRVSDEFVSSDERHDSTPSDGTLLVYDHRPSGLSASRAEAPSSRVDTIVEGGELPNAIDEERIAPRPVIVKDFADRYTLPVPPPAFERRASTDRFAERLRRSSGTLSRSSSTQSLNALLSPRISSPLIKSPLASGSTANLEHFEAMPFTNPWETRRPSKSGRNLDHPIEFDRIRSPMLSPAASLPDLRDGVVQKLDARQPAPLPHAGFPARPSFSTSLSTSSTSSGSGSEDDEDEDELGLGPPPEVPPALEYVDPEIECVAPNASTVTLPLAEARALEQSITHPWVEPPFNVVQRQQPSINKYTATFKIVTSLGIVCSLLVGYGLGVKIVKVGPWSFGMYGLLLVVDFITQTIAASFNRTRVNKLTAKSPLVKGVAERLAAKENEQLPLSQPAPLPECSIAVVGYREDEEAWTACLKSLQAQQYPIKHIIGVVDGNDKPDLDMANAFGKAFPEDQRLIVDLPVLLSVMYKEKYWEHINSLDHKPLSRWQYFKMWLTQDPRPGQDEAHEIAWNYMLNYVHQKADEERWADWKGICFSQPHGHKRHAMFTAFVVGAYALGTKDAMLTTDSDTYVYPEAVKNMMALLFSDEKLAGVTGDVRIWNKSDSFLALMSSIRYWFAFNVERACQSAFGCVGCLSGPLGLYKTSDLISVLGPWILQSFLGKETTFGDDRHLSNRILSLGHKTGYTHLAMCDSDTPAGYVRWVKQQTRWSKSFFREAFWFPKSFAHHRFWLTVETSKQFLYPFVLTATVMRMLYHPTGWIRPLIWLATMFGVAVIKSIYGVICLRDPRQFLFGIYGFMYFFGLLPSKLFACFTVHITNWGTSARSKSEFARPESFLSRSTHVGHLVVWYMMLSLGLSYLLVTVFHRPLFWLVSSIGVALSAQAYSDVITGESKYAYYVLRKKYRTWRAARTTVTDEERITGKPVRGAFKKMRRGKRASKAKAQPATNEVVPAVAEVTSLVAEAEEEPEPTTVVFEAPVTPAVETAPENAHVNLPTITPQAVHDTHYDEVDPFSSENPSIVIEPAELEDLTVMEAPEFGSGRKASVATTATASSYDSVPTPTSLTDNLGNLDHQPGALGSSLSKQQKAGQANRALSIASELAKQFGAGNVKQSVDVPMSDLRKVREDELDMVEELPMTPGAMTVF